MMTAPRSPDAAPAAPPAASAIVPPYDETAASDSAVSPSAIVVLNTSEVVPEPLAYAAVSPLFSDRVPSVVTTASSQVQVICSVSPTPYESSVAVHAVKSGASPSTVTDPRSPEEMAAAAPPAASAIVPLNELTDRSLDAASFSETVYVNTNAAFPVPLA